jgi:LAGLIDADG DNA endonuclease family protein
MVYSREIEDEKPSLKLSDVQRDMLVGLILGDAHLETQSNGRTYRVKFEYGNNHREYANHLYESFREWIRTPPQVKLDATHRNIWFQTLSHSAFRFYAHQFYDERKKCVPVTIHRFLTARGIAYWFMDDGSIKSRESKAVIFNTQGFAQNDVERLVKCLQDSYNLEAAPRKQEDGLQIYVSGKSFGRFREIVDPYILPSMRYKIPPDRLI